MRTIPACARGKLLHRAGTPVAMDADMATAANPATKRRLIRLLQKAYSSEMAAAFAYQGHRGSVRREYEKNAIAIIEMEEWVHRVHVREILKEIGAAPSPSLEFLMYQIGKTLSGLCYISGWFLPMYVAYLLETMNVKEYETAARLAAVLGYKTAERDLLKMAAVEDRHADTFYKLLTPATAEAAIAAAG
ncbi:MAG: ferritin-like domain-containing protein [Planctomycetota bacterium]